MQKAKSKGTQLLDMNTKFVKWLKSWHTAFMTVNIVFIVIILIIHSVFAGDKRIEQMSFRFSTVYSFWGSGMNSSHYQGLDFDGVWEKSGCGIPIEFDINNFSFAESETMSPACTCFHKMMSIHDNSTNETGVNASTYLQSCNMLYPSKYMEDGGLVSNYMVAIGLWNTLSCIFSVAFYANRKTNKENSLSTYEGYGIGITGLCCGLWSMGLVIYTLRTSFISMSAVLFYPGLYLYMTYLISMNVSDAELNRIWLCVTYITFTMPIGVIILNMSCSNLDLAFNITSALMAFCIGNIGMIDFMISYHNFTSQMPMLRRPVIFLKACNIILFIGILFMYSRQDARVEGGSQALKYAAGTIGAILGAAMIVVQMYEAALLAQSKSMKWTGTWERLPLVLGISDLIVRLTITVMILDEFDFY